MNDISKVSIELKPGVYNQFRNLNNKVWYAISEFVDNAVQSYLDNKERLVASQNDYQFSVIIDVNWEKDEMTIADNAAGINAENFERAFEPANIPINNTGLNEYGMGMKTAAIWLADRWTVHTKAFGEDVERSIEFDLHKVIREAKEELHVTSVPKSPETHYTHLTLRNLSKNAPTRMQIDKIRKHLASIYRKFIRTGELHIYVNNEELSYDTPDVLVAPYYRTPDGQDIEWKKDINFHAGQYKAVGFIGILKTMSTGIDNGLSLFRRGRVILGSYDEKYRPKSICGQVGSPRYKRIFGELELEGFDVSFNKSSFQDDADLEEFIELLKSEISAKDFDLYNQAENYRQKTREDSKHIVKNIVKTLKKEAQPMELTQKVQESVLNMPSPDIAFTARQSAPAVEALGSHEEPFEFNGEQYTLKLELIDEPDIQDLYSLTKTADDLFKSISVVYKINLAHPFFVRFENFKKEDDFQPIIAIVKSLVLAELVAPSQGTKNAGNVRLLFNKYLQSQ
jgi:hypothetical protein